MTTVTQGHLAKVRIDTEDCNQSLRAFWDARDNTAAANTLCIAVEAVLRAVSTLTQVVEAQEQGQIAQLRKRDDCAEAYGGFVSW